MNVVDTRKPHPFRDHAEVHAVRLLARVGPVARAMQVQDQPVPSRPLGHRLDRRVSDGEIDHADDAADFLRELGALVHLLHRRGRDVHVMALDLPRLGHGPAHAFHAEQEPIPPPHERLAVDVLVVLGEVEATAERFVDHPPIVARGEPELGLDGGAEQRAAVLV